MGSLSKQIFKPLYIVFLIFSSIKPIKLLCTLLFVFRKIIQNRAWLGITQLFESHDSVHSEFETTPPTLTAVLGVCEREKVNSEERRERFVYLSESCIYGL